MRAREWWPAAAAAALVVAAATYALLRGGLPGSGSLVGHACGIAGYLLMLAAAFGYSWRKSPARRTRGSAQAWMRAHVAAGLAGPALVLLHTGLAFRGLAGVTTLLVVVVVASGAVGRWLHPALPRGVGDAGDGERARRIAEELERLEQEAATREAAPDDEGGAVAVATRAASAAAVEAQRGLLQRLRAEDERRAARALGGARLRRLASAWWVLHVPLAMAMLLLGLVHAVAVLWYRTPTR